MPTALGEAGHDFLRWNLLGFLCLHLLQRCFCVCKLSACNHIYLTCVRARGRRPSSLPASHAPAHCLAPTTDLRKCRQVICAHEDLNAQDKRATHTGRFQRTNTPITQQTCHHTITTRVIVVGQLSHYRLSVCLYIDAKAFLCNLSGTVCGGVSATPIPPHIHLCIQTCEVASFRLQLFGPLQWLNELAPPPAAKIAEPSRHVTTLHNFRPKHAAACMPPST